MSIFNHTPKNNYMICENDENTPSIMPLFTEISGQNDSECKTLNTKGLPILALRNMVLFPGVFICLFTMGFNLFGDALRDALDPTLKH